MSLERMKRVIGILIGLLPFFWAYFAPQPLAVARHTLDTLGCARHTLEQARSLLSLARGLASANQNLLQKKNDNMLDV